jgi:hypothetical protein
LGCGRRSAGKESEDRNKYYYYRGNVMKKTAFLPLIILAVMVIMTAGCVSTATDLAGTWTTGAYTSPSGTHYTKFVEVFNADGTGTETGFFDNGSTEIWNMTWIKTGDSTYLYSYESWTATLSSDGKTITYSDGSVYTREGNTGTGYAGTWTCTQLYYGKLYTITDVLNAENTGSSTWTYENGTQYGSWDLMWYETDENTCFTTYTDSAVLVTMQADGTAKDNYGLIYTKS